MSTGRGRKRRRRKKSAASRQNRLARFAIFGVVMVLLVVFWVVGMNLRNEIKAGEAKAASLREAIDEEEARTARIESMREALSTEEFVKKAAKDRFGLVESGEILFKAEN